MAFRPFPVFAGALALAASCNELQAQQRNNAGLGTVKRWVDLQEAARGLTDDNGFLGCCHLGGLTYVSGRGGPGTTFTKKIYVFDGTGSLANTFDQPPLAQATAWGIRDMDDDGTSLIGGSINGLFVFDTAGNQVNTVNAANGPQSVTQPIAGPALTTLTNFRAVAYDRNGNGGNGSVYVANNGSTDPIIEIDLGGNVLTTFPNQGWAIYGLALDTQTGNVWANGATSDGPIIELDPAAGMAPTGISFPPGVTDFHAGLDDVPGGTPGTYPSAFDVVSVLQTNPDSLYYHRVHLETTYPGYDEARMQGSINADPLAEGDMGVIAGGDTLNWQVTHPNAGRQGFPAWVGFNFGPLASFDGVTTLFFRPGQPLFRELRLNTAISQPMDPTTVIIGTAIGASGSATVPPGLLSCFQELRMQAVYFEPQSSFPFAATNEVWGHGSDEGVCNIVVEAVGANSFNSNTGSGFFRVIQTGGPAITDVTFDWSESSDPAQRATMRFDTDQTGMADIFNAGNSTLATCTGTYRNNSDVTTGLVYDAQNTPPNICAPAGSNTGYIASHQSSATNTWRTLHFRFTSFSGGTAASPVVFEFDADTDGGIGLTGADMAGLFIEVELATGEVLRTELRVDPTVADRSHAGL